MSSDERRWVVAPDEARIEIAVGKDAKISPELHEALKKLAEAIGEPEDEVSGYMYCRDFTIGDCASYISCKDVHN